MQYDALLLHLIPYMRDRTGMDDSLGAIDKLDGEKR
jgi:hypothetical protein